jgi:phosphoglycerate dehydrogenase-like enzyme
LLVAVTLWNPLMRQQLCGQQLVTQLACEKFSTRMLILNGYKFPLQESKTLFRFSTTIAFGHAVKVSMQSHISGYSRATQWTGPAGRNLLGASVTIVGGGGITESLIRLLLPFNCDITVVRRTVEHIDGADTVVGQENLVDALAGADIVFLALSLTRETIGLIGKSELEVMEPHAWIINVARGGHIVTDDLVWALQNNIIGGAALDVTDPEPLPENHPLWTLPNCIITPHVGNTPEMAVPLLSARITENVKRFINDEALIGLVDVRHGY